MLFISVESVRMCVKSAAVVALGLFSVFSSGGASAALPVSGSAFHVDASVSSTMTFVERDGKKFISRWNDASGGSRYASQDNSSFYPWLGMSEEGLPYVDFGPGRYGKTGDSPTGYLKWSSDDTSIREVFLVYSDYPGASGSFLLSHSSSYAFHRGGTKLFNTQYADAKIRGGVIEVDGASIDNATYDLPAGFHIIHLRTTGAVPANRFASDRDNYQLGAQRLREVIVYDTTLSNENAAKVYDYLYVKWMSLTDALHVCGVPAELGTLSPAYGLTRDLGENDPVTCTASASWESPDGRTRATCAGWKLYDRAGTQVGSGAGATCDYVHPGVYRKLVWQWNASHKVTATAGAGGSVDTAEQWVTAGQSVTLTATPATAEDSFVSWTDASGKVLGRSKALTLTIAGTLSVTANFARNYYVATAENGGSDTNDGSSAHPFATVQKALSVAMNDDTVNVGPGTYPLPVTTSRTVSSATFTYGTPSYWLTNAVTVVGTDGPDVTIFDGENRANCYAFCLNNAQAVLSGVTVKRIKTSLPYQWRESAAIELKNGFVTNCVVRDCALYYVGGINVRAGAVCDCQVLNVSCSDGLSLGAGINLTEASTTAIPGITNCLVSGCSGKQGPALNANNRSAKVYGCVFRNCTANNSGRGGLAPVYISGGSVENCVITNNQVSAGSVTCAGIQFANTVVRNCLIADNRNNDAAGSTGGAYMSGASAVLENCTVVNNYAKSETAHGLNQANGTVRNSIIGFNGPTANVFGQAGNHVVSGGTVTYTDTYPAIDAAGNLSEDPKFVSATGDYHLSNMSDLFDKGETQTWMANAKDLDGRVRVSGTAVNPGCYEDPTPAVRPFVATGVSDILAGGNPLTVKFTCSLKNTPDPDDVSYLWTFGDGATSTEAAPTHIYTSCARFTVKLEVTSKGTKAPTYTFPAPIEVGPSVVYVNTTGEGIWPYDEPGKGTNDIVEAMASLHAPANGSAKVYCGPGTFTVRSTVTIKNEPVEIIGDGTTFKGNLLSGLFYLQRTDSVLRGLTFTTSSKASGSSSTADYGGILTLSAGTVTNCTFKDVQTTSYCFSAVILNGGLMTDCLFTGCNNDDSGAGGGGRNCFTLKDGSIVNTVFSNCTAGSAIATGEIRAGVVSNCTFVGCTSSGSLSDGKVIHLGTYGSNPTGTGLLTHSRVICCLGKSGSSIIGYTSGTALRNCLVVGCKAVDGTTLSAARGVTENCTIVSCTNGNATASGIVAAAEATVYNTIVWDCIYTNGVMRNVGGAGTFDHCLTDLDPHFRRPANGDFRLRMASPARDGGVERPWMVGATDLQGNPRILNRAPDIGCYEDELRRFAIILR